MNGHESGKMAAAGLPSVVDIFVHACDSFSGLLVRSDDVADEVDFTGSLHALGFEAGRVSALAEALTLLTGSPAWRAQATEVLAEYMAATTLPEEAN
ncbi:MAG: hypothetical protein JWO42_2801 [Chloroflexi bacterium]|nr:hypothetical protein [Chloroflexota bacterium]